MPVEYKYTIDAWIEALTICKKYDEDGFHGLAAEHDVVYLPLDPEKVSPEDAKRLEELGWHIEYDSYAHYV